MSAPAMCQHIYSDALRAIPASELASRLTSACDRLTAELMPIARHQRAALHDLADAIGQTITLIETLRPVVGSGLIELAQIDSLAELQHEIATARTEAA